MSGQIYFGYQGPSRGGRQYYDDPSPGRRVDEYGDNSYTPTIDLRDAERVATGGKAYPILPPEHPDPYPQSRYWAQAMQETEQVDNSGWIRNHLPHSAKPQPKRNPQPDPAMPYTTGYQARMQQYEDAWELDPALLGQKPRPKPRPRSRQNKKLDIVYRKKPAYNSHWIDVPFLFAWIVWFVLLGFPTMVLAAGLTSGLPAQYGAVGVVMWFLLDIIASFVATTVSRWHHARKTRAINRVMQKWTADLIIDG